MSGYYACGRCYERADDPTVAHVCADRRIPEGGSVTVLLSDDYRTELRELLDDPILHDMAEGLHGVPFPELMHDGGAARFETMLAVNAEYRSRGGTAGRTIGGPSKALIALLIGIRERDNRERMRAERELADRLAAGAEELA